LQKELKEINSNKKNHKFLTVDKINKKLNRFELVKLKDYGLSVNNDEEVMK